MSAVEVNVQAASVLITVVISSPDATAARRSRARCRHHLELGRDSLLSGVGLTVSPRRTSRASRRGARPPDGPADPTVLFLTHAIVMSLRSLCMPSAMAFPLFLRACPTAAG